MQSEASVEIDRPIDEVFDFTVHHVAEWSIIVIEDKPVETKPEGVGSTFHVVTEERGKRMEFDGLVTRHEPPTAETVEMKGEQFDILAEYTFSDLGHGRTRVTQKSTVTPKGFLKIMFALLGWAMKSSSCKAAENELLNLKRLMESQERQAPAS